MDNGRAREGLNGFTSEQRNAEHDVLEELYCVEDEVNRNAMGNEVDIQKYCFQTSILIDWDRRKTIRIDPMLGRSLQEEGSIVWGEKVGNTRSGNTEVNSEPKVVHVMKEEKEMYIREAMKSKGIRRLRSKGRYKVKYVVQKRILLEEVLEMESISKKGKISLEREAQKALQSEVKEAALMEQENLDVTPDDVDDDVIDVVDDDVIDVVTDEIAERTGTNNAAGTGRRPGTSRVQGRLRAKDLFDNGYEVMKKRNFRRRLESTQFKLIDKGGDGVLNNQLKSEEQLFRESCVVGKNLLKYIYKEWIEVPNLRCVHTKANRNRVVSVCSSRVRKKGGNGELKEVVTCCLMVEMKGRDVYCVNVKETRTTSRNESCGGISSNRCSSHDGMSKEELVICSCDIQRVGGIVVNSRCWYVECLTGTDGDSNVLDAIRERIAIGFEGEAENEGDEAVFGEWIVVDVNEIMVGEEAEVEVICTQMDLVDGRQLMERGKCISKRWSLWNVYDVNDELFCCCIRSAVGTGMQATEMKCVQCQYGSQRNCRHETGCMKLLSDARAVTVNEFGEITETGGPERSTERGHADIDSGSEYSTSEFESDEDDGPVPHQGDVVVTDRSNSNELVEAPRSRTRSTNRGKCLYEAESWFASIKTRPLFMCPAEKRITEQLTDQIEEWDRRKGGLSYVEPDGWACGGKIHDEQGVEVVCPHKKGSGARTF